MALATITFSTYLPVEQPHQAPAILSQYSPPPPPKRPSQGGRRSLTEQPSMLAMGQSTYLQFEG